MYNILVIDDDKMMHFVTKKVLGEHFDLIHAYDAQEAVNKLSELKVDLILSDIHMPGIDGLEFLESLMTDAELNNIPVLIMTGQPTVEKEKNALNLGATDFIDKTLFKDNPQDIVEKVEIKLATSLDVSYVPKAFSLDKKEFVQKLMEEVEDGDFFTISRKLAFLLHSRFGVDHIFLWVIRNNSPRLILTMGLKDLQNFGPNDLIKEKTFNDFLSQQMPYLSNHAFGDEPGLFKDASKAAELPAEIGLPFYEVTDREYLKYGKKIPPDSNIFAYLVLKRNKLFTSKEFTLLTKLLTPSGTILWRYFCKL